jgi:hypothetical protein
VEVEVAEAHQETMKFALKRKNVILEEDEFLKIQFMNVLFIYL